MQEEFEEASLDEMQSALEQWTARETDPLSKTAELVVARILDRL